MPIAATTPLVDPAMFPAVTVTLPDVVPVRLTDPSRTRTVDSVPSVTTSISVPNSVIVPPGTLTMMLVAPDTYWIVPVIRVISPASIRTCDPCPMVSTPPSLNWMRATAPTTFSTVTVAGILNVSPADNVALPSSELTLLLPTLSITVITADGRLRIWVRMVFSRRTFCQTRSDTSSSPTRGANCRSSP